MYASSSEARVVVSSCSRMPFSNAMSPTLSAAIPRTSSVPSVSAVAVPPSAAIASTSWSGDGVRTRTAEPDDRAMNSAIVQSAISLPLPITIRWSAVFSISDIRWLDTNTVRPSPASAFIRFLIHKMPSGSRPFTGSSNMSTFGSPSIVAAMPSRWLMPRENPFDRLRATSLRPTSSRASPTRDAGRLLVCARHSKWL